MNWFKAESGIISRSLSGYIAIGTGDDKSPVSRA